MEKNYLVIERWRDEGYETIHVGEGEEVPDAEDIIRKDHSLKPGDEYYVTEFSTGAPDDTMAHPTLTISQYLHTIGEDGKLPKAKYLEMESVSLTVDNKTRGLLGKMFGDLGIRLDQSQSNPTEQGR
jgi:hypothetical protein